MPAASLPSRRNVALLAVATLAVGAALAVDSHPAAAAKNSATKLASGVTLNHQSYSKSGHKQSVYWVTVKMGAHTGLQVATPGNVMGAKPMTTLAMARQEHAVAGLNGDTFYFDNSPRGPRYNPSLGPRGGVMRNGSLLKAPLDDQNAVFSVRSSGKAYIGQVYYNGSFVSSAGGGSKKIASVNSVESAWNGNVTLTDTRLLSHSMPKCSEAVLNPTGRANQFQVAAVSIGSVTTYHRVAGNQRALLSCGKGGFGARNTAYFKKFLGKGRIVTTSIGFGQQGTRTLISGTHQLVRGGKVFNDTKSHAALNEYGNKRMPETFVCVYKDRSSVSLGVFEGHRSGATGVTFAEEAAWLVSKRHCWEAMAVDGSTSSTLVAQKPHHSLTTVNRPTANYKGGMRPQTDGIFVVRR